MAGAWTSRQSGSLGAAYQLPARHVPEKPVQVPGAWSPGRKCLAQIAQHEPARAIREGAERMGAMPQPRAGPWGKPQKRSLAPTQSHRAGWLGPPQLHQIQAWCAEPCVHGCALGLGCVQGTMLDPGLWRAVLLS
ncbi:DNA-directed RNA polymerase II subunit RPB11-like [Platysternon megacephalum]|uniref:DNA-directed RNA polymerase II subunit RPB11-like n=1 Tax=Platysternon megacephalum TaxID=55544 RepID=A0A4D9F217_9SAUR|nr:DNA-directed RNA polymerase II subunit RPB11-like [Platysternon megacephalum]